VGKQTVACAQLSMTEPENSGVVVTHFNLILLYSVFLKACGLLKPVRLSLQLVLLKMGDVFLQILSK
jgi:hypothetical protein